MTVLGRRLLPDMLFVPGIDEAKVAKIWELDASAFVLDLEDAVAAERKAEARDVVVRELDRAARADAPPRYVRINGLTTPHALADLLAVVRPGLAGVLIPKVVGARDVQIVDWVVGQLERERGLPAGAVELLALLETAEGLANARAVAGSSSRLRCLCFGAGDLAADLGVALQPDAGSGELTAFVTALKAGLVIASREAGLEPPHDGVHLRFRDLDALRRTTESARSIGFFGRHAIHPEQIPVIREVFRPSPDEVRWARAVVDGFQAHEAVGNAAFAIDGEFVDYAVAARAQRLLRLDGTP